MEKKKLKLEDLEVKSFVTRLDTEADQTADIQGGISNSCLGITCGKKCDIPTNDREMWQCTLIGITYCIIVTG